jgi:DNA primase
MWIDNCTFIEAVTKLASMRNWLVPRKGLSAADRKKHIMIEQVLKNNREYWNNLQENEPYFRYLEERGITKKDIDKWRIGVVSTSEDKFPGRLVFSLMNDWGQTIGFSYRTTKGILPYSKDNGPKYINSPQSQIFDKGSTLYGLNFVRRTIREKGYVIIGEGFGDTILGQKLELPMVSIMGTSLTDKQIEILKKYTDTIILWLDGDGGGIGATTRHAKVLRKDGFIVKVINYLGKDPDDVFTDLIDKFGIEKAIESVQVILDEQSVMASQFDIKQAMSQFDSIVMEHKLRTVRQIKPIIDQLDDKTEYEVFLEQVAKRLDVSIQTLID